MIGSIIGDIVGSRFEFHNHLSKDFEFLTQDCRFTDDTVMTCAVARALMDSKEDYSDLSEKTITAMQQIGQKFPNCGYGARFIHWMFSDNPQPYNSCGNGSAMRISPIGFVARDVDEAKKLSAAVTCISHDHPEGMKGAEATAVAIVMAREGKSKDEIKTVMEEYYDLSMTVEQYRDEWQGHGKEICQVSLPQALACFFEGESYEDVIRNCISIGGDSDTIAAIAGGIAEAYYGVPEEYWIKAERYLPWSLLQIVLDFQDWAKTIKPTSDIETKEEISADDQHKLNRYVITNGADNTDILAVGANSWDARATLLEYLEKNDQHVGVVISTYPGLRHDESAYIDYYVIGPANIFEQELKEHADAHQWCEKYYHYMENIDSKELMEWITSQYHYDDEIWTYEEDSLAHKSRIKRMFEADDRVVHCVDIEDKNSDEWKKLLSQGYCKATLKKRIQEEK